MEEKKNKNIFEKAKEFIKTGAEKVKEQAKIIGEAAMGVIAENPILLIPIITSATAILGGGIKKIQDGGKERAEACRIPNNLTGVDWELKRPMTNEQNMEYENRLINGQTPGDALDEMGLLK